MCGPSRTCLATGKHYHQFPPRFNFNGGPPVGTKTVYSALRDGGYHTMTCGKDDLQKGDATVRYRSQQQRWDRRRWK